jgi:replication factor C subunit 3/5
MPSEAAHNDVFVLIKLMKETAANAFATDAKNSFLTFVIYDAENMSLKAQAALRRTMEKYANNIRIVMVCLSTASLIPALKSRCLMIRNPAPTNDQVTEILREVVRREGLKKVTDENIRDVVEKSERNLRKALLALQACVARNEFTGPILEEHWRNVVGDRIVGELIRNRSVEAVKTTRNVFYDLLACQVPGDLIIREILWQLLKKIDFPDKNFRIVDKEGLIMNLKEVAVSCEKQMKQGDRMIIYLEGFLIKAMLAVEQHSPK